MLTRLSLSIVAAVSVLNLLQWYATADSAKPTAEVKPAGDAGVVEKMPGLVAFWTFGEEPGKPRQSAGTTEAHPLAEIGGPIARAEGGSYSGYAIHFNGKQYLSLPYKELGSLNISGKDAQVSMFAVVNIDEYKRGVTIAGIWNEGKGAHDDSGSRQYSMLINMPTYGGPRQLTPHISSEGGVSRRADGTGLPWCADYAATRSQVPEKKWVTLGFTYDSRYIRAYFNGVMEERPVDPKKDRREDPYFTKEGPDGKHRGINPYYHGRGIFAYDPGKYGKTKPNGGADFTVAARMAVGSMLDEAMKGRMAGLAVFNRALTDDEMKKLHDSANIDALK